jgi:two-component system, NtrC family, sensor kinase
MRLDSLNEYLLPKAPEQDEGFCQEIFRLSHLGLRVVGGLEIGAAIFILLAVVLLATEPVTRPSWLGEAAVLGVVGLASLAVARTQWSYERSRLLAGASVFCGAAALIWFSLAMRESSVSENFLPGQIALMMMVGVTMIPLRPVQTLALGFCVTTCLAGVARLTPQAGPYTHDLLFLVLLTGIATGLTVLAYRQRHLAYQAYIQIVGACEGLRASQTRMLVSENAASMARLAAALSHELNTPMGALLSGVNTLLSLADKRATAPSEQQDRLSRLQADLLRSVEDSAQRLQQTVARMQRFTNLDKTEVQPANLNELLGDVAALLEPQIQGRAKLELDFQPVPILLVRRQHLSAVFSSLLNNAAGATNHDGRIVISTRQRDSSVEVQIRDNGVGVAPEQMRNIFDPGFKNVDGRILTGNWHMFNSRQIIREHGGEIKISSEEGRGTTVTVTLPLAGPGNST